MISERDIVARLANAFPSTDGIGDDAAILAFGDETCLVIGKDLLVEDVHFRRRYFSPADLARKALEVNLSDIAAMGAIPDSALLGLSLPADLDTAWLAEFLDAFVAACHARGVTLIGGDTTGSADRIVISITALGRVAASALKRRSGARADDAIYVAGYLGHADLGLRALESNLPAPSNFIDALCRPSAKLREGEWLGRQAAVTAMMDISDGLRVDLGRLCVASGVGAVLDWNRLPRDPAFDALAATLGRDPVHAQLDGGEDYGLLFTAGAHDAGRLARSFMAAFGYAPLTVGVVTNGSGVNIVRSGVPLDLTSQPFSHFGEDS